MGDGCVYIVGSGKRCDPVKIGWSGTPQGRVKSLQTGAPYALKILSTHPGPRGLETFLHHRFADLRMHGEWFDFGDEDPVARVEGAVQAWGAGERDVVPLADRALDRRTVDMPSGLRLVEGGVAIDMEVGRKLVRLSHPQLRIMIFYLVTEKNPAFNDAVVLTVEQAAEVIGMNRSLMAKTLPSLLKGGWLRQAHRRGNVWYYGLGPAMNP